MDAGAKGFTLFIQGIADYFKYGDKIKIELSGEEEIAATQIEVNHDIHSEITYCYCTECLLEGEGSDTTSIKETLTRLGDSLVVAGNKRLTRIHLHTNEPARVFEILHQKGTITYKKADDINTSIPRSKILVKVKKHIKNKLKNNTIESYSIVHIDNPEEAQKLKEVFTQLIGVVLWLVGYFFESVGDAQLKRFKKNPRNKGRITDKGLWSLTRHPNYFGNSAMWFGIFLIAISNWNGLWIIVGPVVMTLIKKEQVGLFPCHPRNKKSNLPITNV